MSDVNVRVSMFDKVIESVTSSKKEFKINSFAVLTDGNSQSDIMPLHQCFSFETSVEEAFQKKVEVKITRLISVQGTNEIVLVPTSETEIIPNTRDKICKQTQKPTSSSESIRAFVDAPMVSSVTGDKNFMVLKIIDVFLIDEKVSLISNKVFRLLPSEFASVLVHSSNDDNKKLRYRRSILTLSSINQEGLVLKVILNSNVSAFYFNNA